jgi:hypothetical protein
MGCVHGAAHSATAPGRQAEQLKLAFDAGYDALGYIACTGTNFALRINALRCAKVHAAPVAAFNCLLAPTGRKLRWLSAGACS